MLMFELQTVVTVLTDVIPQESLTGKGFAAMLTHQRLYEILHPHQKQHHTKNINACQSVVLTYGLGLSLEVVKQLGVAGEHAPTCGTSHKPLLSVAAHVLPKPVPDLEEGVAPC